MHAIEKPRVYKSHKRIDKVFSKLWHKAKCLRLKNFGGDKSTNKKDGFRKIKTEELLKILRNFH